MLVCKYASMHAPMPALPKYAYYYPVCQYAKTIHATIPVCLYALTMHTIIQSASMPRLFMLQNQSASMPCLCILPYNLPVCPAYALYYPICQHALTLHATMLVCPNYACFYASIP